MTTTNVTLSLAEDLVRRAKVFAAEHDTSVSALVGDALAGLVDGGPSDAQSWRAEEDAMSQGLLEVGARTVSRDELHRR